MPQPAFSITDSLRITVIICAYTEDRWDQLVDAIQSVQCQTRSVEEIVAVIDHNPRLYQRLCEQFPSICVVENQEPQGLSGARNTGIAAASGDIIAFLDDDAVAEPDWMAKMVKHLHGPQVMGVGGAVVPLWQTGRPAWFPEEFLWVVGCTYRGLPVLPAQVRNPMGGCMFWRREVFQTVGNFYTGLGHKGKVPTGCEETELCIRARRQWPGSYFMYEPQARIHHHVPAGRARFSYFRKRCYSEGISKALVVKLAGSSAGLSSERTYTLKTLPRGFFRGLFDGIRGDFSGFGRSSAIFMGLFFTTAGYIAGTFQRLTNG